MKGNKKFEKSLKHAGKEVKRLDGRMKRLGGTLQSVGRALALRVTMPIAGLGLVATTSFAKLERGLINTNNLLQKDELAKYGGTLENLQTQGIRAGYTISDVNKGLFDTISAMGASEQTFKAFSVAQKLAIGGNTELGIAVKGIAAIMNTYRAENVSALDAANAFFSAQVKGVTTVRELADNVGAVAPIARAAGTSFQELLATMTALTLGGLRTDNATTALRGAFNALVKPQENAAKAMDSMGIVYGGANIKALGITESFRSMKVAIEKYGIDAVAKAIPNIRAFTAVTSMSDYQLRKVKETIVKIQSDMKTGDGLMRAWKDQTKSLSWTFLRAKGAMTIAMKNFVKVFAPELKLILATIARLTQKIAELPRPVKKVVLTLLVMTALLPPLLISLGLFAKALPFIASGLTMVAIAGAGATVGLAGLLLPITAGVAVATALVGVFVGMYMTSGILRNSLKNLGGSLWLLINSIKIGAIAIGNFLNEIDRADASRTFLPFLAFAQNLSLIIDAIANGIKFIVQSIKGIGSLFGAVSVGDWGGVRKILFEDKGYFPGIEQYNANLTAPKKLQSFVSSFWSGAMAPTFSKGLETEGHPFLDPMGEMISRLKAQSAIQQKFALSDGNLNISLVDSLSADKTSIPITINRGSNRTGAF